MEYWNRSTEVTATINEERGSMKFFIDGKACGEYFYSEWVTKKSLVNRSYCSSWGDVEKIQLKKPRRVKCGIIVNGELPTTTNGVRVEKIPSKEFFKKYGITLKQAVPLFNKMMYARVIGHYERHSSLYRGRGGKVTLCRFQNVVEMVDTLDEAVQDGNKHLTPFIAFHKETLPEIRSRYGKGLWKKLCKNSYSRNLTIIRMIEKSRFGEFHGDDGESLRKLASELNEIPSTALNVKHNRGDLVAAKCIVWAKKHLNRPYSQKESRLATRGVENKEFTLNLVMDAYHMANQHGLFFSFDWSLRRMKDEHDRIDVEAKRINRERTERYAAEAALRKEKWAIDVVKAQNVDLSQIYPQVEWELDGVTAKMLTTYDQVQKEGDEMHHCVWSYAKDAMLGCYAVVHLSGDGEESTLGVSMYEDDGVLKFAEQQHYRAYNQIVKSEIHRNLAKSVVESLNAMNLDKRIFNEK